MQIHVVDSFFRFVKIRFVTIFVVRKNDCFAWLILFPPTMDFINQLKDEAKQEE